MTPEELKEVECFFNQDSFYNIYGYYQKFSNETRQTTSASCYGGIMSSTRIPLIVAGTIGVTNKTDQRFWDWITGKTSPIRNLIDVAEIHSVMKNEQQIGYYFETKHLKIKNDYRIIMAIMTFLRQTREFGAVRHLWERLVEKGIEENRAYVIANLFRDVFSLSMSPGRTYPLPENVLRINPNTPSHSPVSFHVFDLHRWLEGNVNRNTYGIQNLWKGEKSKNFTFRKKEPLKTRIVVNGLYIPVGETIYTEEEAIQEYEEFEKSFGSGK